MSFPKVIGFGSRALVGKDYAASLCLNELHLDGVRVAFADELKRDLNPFIKDKTGWDISHLTPEQKELVRPLMVSYGTHLMRSIDEGYWIHRLINYVQNLPETPKIIIIPDVRYVNEVDWVRQHGIYIDIEAWVPFVNEEEKKNSHLCRSKADHLIYNHMDHNSLLAALAFVLIPYHYPVKQ